ncbi:hypothetical protein [Priestia megaterium]|uniref:hypothetical protein n=1 Tax=Priestia megaterium TaxID=1404 RepID=UPI0020D284DB|nr:hypothetical protein [Priestia megaterium]
MAEIKVKELFTEAKKVMAAYKEEAEKLDKQERELNAELESLQAEMTANILAQENAGVSDLVYLKIQAKEAVKKSEIIDVLLEELKEERTELKLKYVPLIRQALGKSPASEYDATEIAERYRYLMLKEISEIGKQMQAQYYEIAPEVAEVFEDEGVLEQYPRLKYHFTYENYTPSFSWFDKSVVSKNEVFSACRGNFPQGLKQPKDVK